MKKILLMILILFIASPKFLRGGFLDKVEKFADNMEKIEEKKSKVDRIQNSKDRIKEREERKRQEKKEEKARQEQRENQKKMMEQQMCSQYNLMNSSMVKDAYKNDKKLKQDMQKQTILAIDSINIEYKKLFNKKYDYKNQCK